ncbi:hypothetical protein FNL39_101312 [Nocardia caishijiensis]|uniref:Uncharacterized protein n=1 Tax=Nocardia caishijiensis TaxID=184756 RepID=A0ABQ6YTY3_9NOCA|nr:hypothetical protein FNL39_101312 [Nocardia caishijiensis]
MVGFAVIGVLASVFTAYQVVTHWMSDQVVISCRPDSGRAYCVYHRTTPGLLATEREMHVGIAPNRGLFYDIPYSAADVQASWNAETGLLTITMPGTELRIAEAEYRDR